MKCKVNNFVRESISLFLLVLYIQLNVVTPVMGCSLSIVIMSAAILCVICVNIRCVEKWCQNVTTCNISELKNHIYNKNIYF